MLINVPQPKKYKIYPVCHTTLWISCFIGLKNPHKINFYPLLDLDAKSINADVSETDDQNNDTHSYLTISDKSDRLYAAVHYDEVEDRKSNSPI